MIKLIFFILLIIVIVLLLILATGGPAVLAQEEPTPYITATAPMPGDPPPSQDWLDGVATREAAFQQTKDARYHSEPYPPPFETPTPYAYPGDTAGQTDLFTPSDAGLWAFIWDLLTGK